MRVLPLFLVPAVCAYVLPALHAEQDVLVEEQDGVLGLGVHFTTSYAAAAVRYEDGRVEELVRVPASAEWIAAMGRWADESNAECITCLDNIRCGIERRWNTWRGRHATEDIGILSVLMMDVKAEIVARLEEQRYPTSVVITTPVLPALEAQDFREALAYSRLGTKNSPILLETNAAFAGLGNGLCESWNDYDLCAEEEAAMDIENTLFLSFDNSSFSATLQPLSTAYNSVPSASILDVQLGWDSLPIYEVARAKFWARVQDAIMEVITDENETVDTLVLTGEFGDDEEFWQVVKGAMEGKWREGETSVWVDMHEQRGMTAARGAAEIAARSEYWRRVRAGLVDEYEYEYEYEGEEEEDILEL